MVVRGTYVTVWHLLFYLKWCYRHFLHIDQDQYGDKLQASNIIIVDL